MDDVFFEVAFYDKDHAAALSGTSVYNDIETLTKTGLRIPYSEFKSYAIFREQSEDPEFVTFRQLQEQLSTFIPVYEKYYEHSGDTIYLRRHHAKQQGKTQTEMGGVGGALSTASRLYGLTEADWQRIPESREKDLDFMRSNPRLASNGNAFIQVEAKGHAIEDTSLKTNLSGDVIHIKGKKASQRSKPAAPTEFLGFITTFPLHPGQYPRIWITDPPSIGIVDDPRKLRLLKRLYFYWKAFGVLSAPLAYSLINRIYALAMARDYQSLSAAPLLTGRGRVVKSEDIVQRIPTVISPLSAVGEVIRLDDSSFFFYGFDRKIVDVLTNQWHEDIESLEFAPSGNNVEFTAVLSARNLGPEFRFLKGKRINVAASGKIMTNSAGRAFGSAYIDKERLYGAINRSQ